jgi:alkanesulfonate monooxygenase SsuD/methylene tetrahydromethanopterin reductase-like flavin-dependent oxidoreductase (luciferase family)
LDQIRAFPSARITFPNSHFSADTANRLLNDYFDEYVWADECGFDGLMVNEHHNTPTCMNVQVNISAGVLARSTSNAQILLLGNMLPVWDNPARLAEEIALVDVLSGGRVISGIVRGIGPESWATNTNPVYNRERFEEAHDLLIKCWTEPGPFRWEGKHYHFRALNPWMLPLQKPHPPIWTPGTGSPETVEWAARHRYTYAAFLTPLHVAEGLFNLYRSYASQDDWVPVADNFAFMIGCVVAETDKEAQEVGQSVMWRFKAGSGGPREYWAPAGYLPLPPLEAVGSPRAGGRPAGLSSLTYDELQSNTHLIVGSPQTVTEKLCAVVERLGIGHLLLEGQLGALPHDATMRSVELLGKEVIPALRGRLRSAAATAR